MDEVAGLESFVATVNFGGGTHHEETGAVATPIRIYDGRGDVGRFSLHESGFELIEAPAVSAAATAHDLYDADQCVEHLFPIAEAIALRHCPGAARALAFDHILRNPARLHAEAEAAEHGTPPTPRPKTVRLASEPVIAHPPPAAVLRTLRRQGSLSLRPRLSRCGSHEQASHEFLAVLARRGNVCAKQLLHEHAELEAPAHLRTRFLQGTLPHAHGDYTARSGRTRAEQLLRPFVATEAALVRALAERFAIVNLWIPFKTVESDPLAVCTWYSCGPRDVRTNRLTFAKRVGETYKVVAHPDSQRWVYFSRITPKEVLLLKTFDTKDDDGGRTARFCLHSAFSLPGDKEDLPPRESMEVRVLVLYSPEARDSNFLVRPFVPPHVAAPLASHTEGVIEMPDAVETLPSSDDW